MPTVHPQAGPEEIAQAFFRLWQEGHYESMYDLLSQEAQARIARQDFLSLHRQLMEEATATSLTIHREETRPDAEEGKVVAFRLVLHTAFFGDIELRGGLPLVREEGPQGGPRWRVAWHPSVLVPGMDYGDSVRLFIKDARRGTIYDRQGRPLALDAEVPVVGVVPALVEDPAATALALSRALGLPLDEVHRRMEADVPEYYFVPVAYLPYDTGEAALEPFYRLIDLGVVVRKEVRRLYPYGPSAAHVLGYLREITAQELAERKDEGYRPGDLVGAAGLEALFQDELAGEKGGTLAIVGPDGRVKEALARKEPRPGLDVHLALDIHVQRLAEAALGQEVGAVIVMDPRDNSVLALASFPRFDPNAFVRGLSPQEAHALLTDPTKPFLNRALMATYPTGSVFKVVTMAAGLERGGFTPESRLPCPPVWYGLGPAYPKRNWQSVDRGLLTPAQGLMASCNPVFYEMGLTLDRIDPHILPEFGRAFGFGAPTGIGLPEAAGLMPDPEWKEEALGEPWYSGDTVNLSIGQGFLLATPIQIANAYSAIAAGGVLRRPLLVTKVTDQEGRVVKEFRAEEIRRLPISPTTLAAIQEGLRLVTQNPGGTTYGVFAGAGLDVVGKSGQAEDLAFGYDHVFFVGYGPRSSPAYLVLSALERGTSSARQAAPIVRDVFLGLMRGGLAYAR